MKRKIICPSCKEVIEADSDFYSLYCPVCSKQFRFEKGKYLFDKKYSKFKKRAHHKLFQTFDYQSAFSDYHELFLMDESQYKALLGLLISSIKSSTVRISNIHFCIETLRKYFDILYVNKKNAETIYSSFYIINNDLDEYLLILKERLSNKNIFFEEEGLKLYLTAVKDIISFKELYVLMINKFNLEIKLPHIDTKEDIELSILSLTQIVDQNFAINPHQSGAQFLANKESSDIGVTELVFPNKNKLFRNYRFYFYTMIVSLFIALVGVALIFIFPSKLLIGVPIASVFLIILIIYSFLFSRIKNSLLFKETIKLHL